MSAFGDAMARAACDREDLTKRRVELMRKFIKPQMERFPGADEEVLMFIAGVRLHKLEEHEAAIEDLFLKGYCYYFAHMLKEAFHRGIVCNNGRSHILWLDGTNQKTSIAYDILGVNCDYEVLIPVKAMGLTVFDFMHVPGLSHGTTAEEVLELVDEFRGRDDLRLYV